MFIPDYRKEETYNLIIISQKGDIKATEELIRRVQNNIFAFFSYLTHRRSDAADLTQETLLKMAKNIKNIKEPKSFKTWLNHIASNTFFDYLKAHTHDKDIIHNENKILEIKDTIGCEPGEKCLFSEMEILIKSALLNLPSHLRIAIVLREYEGLSYDDISKITNTTLGTVKSRIARARLKLQNQLKDFI